LTLEFFFGREFGRDLEWVSYGPRSKVQSPKEPQNGSGKLRITGRNEGLGFLAEKWGQKSEIVLVGVSGSTL
jgi:hypothetical protein